MRTKCDRCDAVEARQHELVKENEELKAKATQMSDVIEEYVKQTTSLRESLNQILNEGNLAAQGKWDATDKMKDIAYKELAGDKCD
jgi:predicted nuclease with TOPRIM domain